jgi:hypothetical protein
MELSDFTKANVLAGVAIGVGAALLAPAVLPLVSGAARPIVKGFIKAALIAYEQGQEATAELGEFLEDMTAEARAELEAERTQHAAAAAAAAAGAAGGAAAGRRARRSSQASARRRPRRRRAASATPSSAMEGSVG